MALEFESLSLKDFLNAFYKEYADFQAENKQELKDKLESYKQNYEQNKNQNEPAIVANALAPLFESLGFQTKFAHKHKGNSEIDLALLKDSNVEILIEAKKPDNVAEMFKADKPNCKALHECILYYFRERENGLNRNTNIQFIIITDFYQFYLFEAGEFKRYFYDNSKIKKLYKDLESPQNSNIKTQEDFYRELKPILEEYLVENREGDLFNIALKGLYFDLRNDKHLSIAHKVLNRDFLHREYKRDPNALNPRFYKELLHILGLKEFDKGGKITIELDSTQSVSFAKHIASKLEFHNKPSDFEAVMSHILIWLNRVLFLKLIEANLLHFNDFNKDLRFLSSTKITSFKHLSHLFFEVLAKDYEARKQGGGDKGFNFLPYLNSSLFIRDNALEILDIGTLDDDLTIQIFESTQTAHTKDKTCKFLTYLFDFLNAFDFGKESNEDSAHKDLIRSSVLGAVFEKLNGYKEGSFYTPSFITSYMCRESLSKIVIDKFNAAFAWSAQSLEDLRKQIDRDFGRVESQAKRLLESIRICDPSVGSGHFLVSALNEMIAIYHKLGLLEFGYKDLQIKDDEIYLVTKEGEKFAYKRLQDSNHTIQIALFTLKKSIIENNLFGVDINPNSCNIARLRLWIELLKNAYYLNFSKDIDSKIHKLQTLPNIDINIKCGNSLISHFETYEYDKQQNPQRGTFAWLKKQDSTFSNNFKEKLLRYNELVQIYKEKLGNKQDIDKEIHSLKTFFKDTLLNNGYTMESLEKNLGVFVRTYGDECFDMETPFGMEMIRIIRKKNLKFQLTLEELEPKPIEKKRQDLLALIHKEFNTLESLHKSDTFEWRFAFPEVLDLETFEEKQRRVSANNAIKAIESKENKQEIKDTFGDFLGFDLIIGNPPYIRQEAIKELKPHLQKAFSIYKGTSDIYTYFYELGFKILKDNGILSFITSNKWCRAAYGEPLRKFLLENTTIHTYLDLNGVKVFESATVDTSILEFHKAKANASHSLNYANPKDYNPKQNEPLEESLELTQIPQDSLNTDSFIFTSPEIATLKAKIEKIGTPLKDWDINIYRGILTGCNDVKVNGKKEGVFIITSEKRAEILSICDNSKNSLKPYLAFEYNEKLAETKRDLEYKNGFLMINEKERTEQIIKPILRGQDIKRYNYAWANLWLICTRNSYIITKEEAKSFGLKIKDFKTRKRNDIDCVEIPPIDIEEYPALKAHFDEIANKGESKGKGFYNRDDKGVTPYNLRNCAYLNEFAKPKISWQRVTQEPSFIIESGYYLLDSMAFLTHYSLEELHYLLGFLNSKAIFYYFKNIGHLYSDKGFLLSNQYVERFPIPKIYNISRQTHKEIMECVGEILTNKKQDSTSDTKVLESRLDSLIYQIYGLNENEINLIESELSTREREREQK